MLILKYKRGKNIWGSYMKNIFNILFVLFSINKLSASNNNMPLFPKDYTHNETIKKRAKTLPIELTTKNRNNHIYKINDFSFLMNTDGYFVESIDKYGTDYLKGWIINDNLEIDIDKGPIEIQSDYEDEIKIFKGDIIQFFYKTANRYRRYKIDLRNLQFANNTSQAPSWYHLHLFPVKKILGLD